MRSQPWPSAPPLLVLILSLYALYPVPVYSRVAAPAAVAARHLAASSAWRLRESHLQSGMWTLRGGGGHNASSSRSRHTSSKNKKKKKKQAAAHKPKISSNRDLSDHLKVDVAENMGRVIRDSKDQLLSDPDPSLTRIHTLHSLSAGLGNSSPPTFSATDKLLDRAPPTLPAALLNYLLRSHGNAYPLQTAASALAVFYASAALCTVDPGRATAFFRRCNAAALARHASGLIGAAVLAARGIRGETARGVRGEGLSRVKSRMEELSAGAVGQYLFACSLLVLWAGCADPKWMVRRISIFVLLAPVLMREATNVLWTIGDILGIMAHTEGEDGRVGGRRRLMQFILEAVDRALGLILGPLTWRKASAIERQRILAKLIKRISLVAELATAGILTTDGIQSIMSVVMVPSQDQPTISISLIVQKILYIRLYVNFLQAKSRSVSDLAQNLKGVREVEATE